MNLNDMRANAYTNAKNNKTSDEKKEKIVKPFIPKEVIHKSDVLQQNQKIQNQISQNQINQNQINQKTQQVKNFQPVSFVKTVDNFQTKEEAKRQRIFDAEKQLSDVADHLKNGGLVKVPVEKAAENGKESVYRRVAKFLLLIGEDEAAKILPHLTEKQIEKIIPEIASIRSVSSEEASEILEEFNLRLEQEKASGGVETARDILTKAYGKSKAEQMIAKSVPPEREKPFVYLNDEDKEKIFLLLKDENIGVQTLVLSHINPKKAADVINMMEKTAKEAVVLRLAKMEPINPELIRRVDAAMKEKNLNIAAAKSEVVDGRNALAQILKKMDSRQETEILNNLSDEDPDLGDDLKSRLFTIDDVINADDRFIQEKLREMKDDEIAYLIAGKKSDFMDKILYNISSDRREEVLTQSDILKPMKKSDVEEITGKFIGALRAAYDEGKLLIKNRNEEQFV